MTRQDKRGLYERTRKKKFNKLRNKGILDEYYINKARKQPLEAITERQKESEPLQRPNFLIKLFKRVFR